MMAKLSEDDEYRKQYLHAWSLVRSAVDDDIIVDSAPSTSAPPPKMVGYAQNKPQSPKTSHIGPLACCLAPFNGGISAVQA